MNPSRDLNQRTDGIQHSQSMTCAEFQEHMPELYEGETTLCNHPHPQECENCAALVRDLEYIAEQVKFLMPIHEPSPKVWENISASLARGRPAEDDPRQIRRRKWRLTRVRRCDGRRFPLAY